MIKRTRFCLRTVVRAAALVLACAGGQAIFAQDLPPVKGNVGTRTTRQPTRTAPPATSRPQPARPQPSRPQPTRPQPSASQPTQTAPSQPARPTPQADQRIRAALDSIGYQYEIDQDGDYKLTLEVPNSNGRTQLVYVNTKTERLGSMEIREVWAPAIRSNGPFSEAISNQLLKTSYDTYLGAWQTMLFQNGQVYMAVYAAKIAAASDPQALKASIDAVLKTADGVELQVTGKDDF